VSKEWGFKIRDGNRALQQLLSRGLGPEAQVVIEKLPELAHSLFFCARRLAANLLKEQLDPGSRFTRLTKSLVTGHGTARTHLATCIFDLELTAVFNRLIEDLGDNTVASLFVDALLYQATGHEASLSPEDAPIFNGNTHEIRGIHKYQVAAKKFAHIGDSDAWAFGKEFSSIASDNPANIYYIVEAVPYSILARARAKWIYNSVVHGVKHTEEEEHALQHSIKEQSEKILTTIKVADAKSGKYPLPH
jgi:hypothetical protein